MPRVTGSVVATLLLLASACSADAEPTPTPTPSPLTVEEYAEALCGDGLEDPFFAETYGLMAELGRAQVERHAQVTPPDSLRVLHEISALINDRLIMLAERHRAGDIADRRRLVEDPVLDGLSTASAFTATEIDEDVLAALAAVCAGT